MNDLEHRRAFVAAAGLPGQHGDRPEIAGRLAGGQVGDAVRQHTDLDAGAIGAERRPRRIREMRDVAFRASTALTGLGEEDVGLCLPHQHRVLPRLNEADLGQRGDRLYLIDADMDAQRPADWIGPQHFDPLRRQSGHQRVRHVGLDVNDHVTVDRVRHVGLERVHAGRDRPAGLHLQFVQELRINLPVDRRSRVLLANQRLDLRERFGRDIRRARLGLRFLARVRVQTRARRHRAHGDRARERRIKESMDHKGSTHAISELRRWEAHPTRR